MPDATRRPTPEEQAALRALLARVGHPSLRLRFALGDVLTLLAALLSYQAETPDASASRHAQHLAYRLCQRLRALDPGFQQLDPWHQTFAEQAEDV